MLKEKTVTTGARARILIADDQAYSRLTIADMLKLDAYCVSEWDGEGDLLAEVERRRPDLILLDALLAQGDTLSLGARLKKNPQSADIPLIVLSVSDDPQLRAQCRQAGADAYLLKPLERLELLNWVDLLIQKRQLTAWIGQIEAVLFRVAETIENRYSVTDGRLTFSELVGQFGAFIALSPEDIHNLLFAARLHDLGMVNIPDAVMLKTEPLTPAELELVRQHVLVGEKLFEPLAARQDLRQIMRHHHERWDGSGYPDGLQGDEIPFLAQVFQIIDIFNALVNPRVYKPALSTEAALKVLQEESQRGWRNPQLVGQFIAFMGEAQPPRMDLADSGALTHRN
ncbi:MAG: HD-GYP domain-containing protein [Cyanobacteriota bacterium]|jgi:putative two-component system response regulator